MSSLLAIIAVVAALAAVTITGFVVEAGNDEIYVNWETAARSITWASTSGVARLGPQATLSTP